MSNSNQNFRKRILAFMLYVFFLCTYLSTLCPFIYWKDAGELTTAVATLGICHPSGYPVYAMFGFLFSHFPVGDIAFRVNLFSAISGALVPVVIYFFVLRMRQPLFTALLAALISGLAHEIWLESSVTEIYSFSLLLIISSALFFSGKTTKDFYLASFCLGMSLAHHLTTLLLIPAFFSLGVSKFLKLSFQQKMFSFLVFFLAMSSLIYLPVRSHQNPVSDFGNPETFSLLKNHYLTKHYASKMWPESIRPILKRFHTISLLMVKQYGIGIVLMAGVGFAGLLLRKQWRWFVLFFLGAHGAFLLYPPDHSFLIPAIALFGILFAYACTIILQLIRSLSTEFSSLKIVYASLILFVIPLTLYSRNLILIDKSDHDFAWHFGRRMLDSLPAGSLLLTNGDNAFSLVGYARLCEHYRDDVIHIHKPAITWPDHYRLLKSQHPKWFSKQDAAVLDLNFKAAPVPSEAPNRAEFEKYIEILANFCSSASKDKEVFWEGGSDVFIFYKYLSPEGLTFRFSRAPDNGLDPDHQFRFWQQVLQSHITTKSFLLDHNAVSEYSVILFNQANYYALLNNRYFQDKYRKLSAALWKSQLDPEPHNELVEGLGKTILNFQ